MSQLNYNFEMVIGQSGQKADSGFDNVLSYNAEENLDFGLGLVQGVAENGCQLPKLNVAVLSFDADFVTANEIDLDVNGEAITTVPFNTDHATTLADLAAEINDLDNITATVTGAREITVVGEGIVVLIENIAVTGGASQANGTAAYSNGQAFIGIAVLDHAREQDLDGNAQYKQFDAVSVMSKGRIYVYVEQEVAVSDPVYLRVNAGGANELPGQFRMDADSGDAILLSRVRWMKGAAAGGIAVLEVNLV